MENLEQNENAFEDFCDFLSMKYGKLVNADDFIVKYDDVVYFKNEYKLTNEQFKYIWKLMQEYNIEQEFED